MAGHILSDTLAPDLGYLKSTGIPENVLCAMYPSGTPKVYVYAMSSGIPRVYIMYPGAPGEYIYIHIYYALGYPQSIYYVLGYTRYMLCTRVRGYPQSTHYVPRYPKSIDIYTILRNG